MIINHNMSAIFTERNLKFNGIPADKDMEKLSSGMRINRAGDDASGLAVSEKMRSQIRGLRQAETNSQNGISFIQTAEGYLQESQDILQRLRELSVQASNGIYSNEDRMQIQVEVSALVSEVNRIASHAQFNGMNMLTGRFARATGENAITASMWLHIGANMDQRIRVFIGTMTAQGLGVQGANGLPANADLHLPVLPGPRQRGHRRAGPRAADRQQAARGPGRLPEQAGVRHEGAVGRSGEPAGRGVPDPGHRHGGADGGVREGPDPRAVLHRHARPGEHEAADGAAALPLRAFKRTRLMQTAPAEPSALPQGGFFVDTLRFRLFT